MVAVTGLVSALLIECGARLLLPAVEPDFEGAPGQAGFDWRDPFPYVAFSATPDADVRIAEGAWIELQSDQPAHVVTERHGFRYRENLSAAKAPGELRVFLLGGSVTVLGLSNESTICGHLEQLIVRKRPQGLVTRCISAGIMTGVSDQELARLVHHVARLSPDVVISLSGFNDAAARTHFDPRLGVPAPWAVFEKAYREGLDAARDTRDAVASLSILDLILSRSRAVTSLRPDLALHNLITARQIQSAERAYTRLPMDTVAARFIENWEFMRLYSTAIGAEFVGILQPFNPDHQGAGQYAAFYDSATQMIAERQEQGAPYYSFDGLFDDQPELFYDPVHTYDRGHAIFAERILRILEDRALLEAS